MLKAVLFLALFLKQSTKLSVVRAARPPLALLRAAAAEMGLLALQLTGDADAIDVVLSVVVAIAAETAVIANRCLVAVDIAVAITCNRRCGYR